MTLGIFVEGESDEQSIPILIDKIGYEHAVHTRRARQGSMLNAPKMSRHISALVTLQPAVHRVLIFRDSEGVRPRQTMNLAAPVRTELNRMSGGIPVDFIIVDHSLEGWLACDTEALARVVGRNARINTRGNPEDNLYPAQLMKQIFSENGLKFQKTRDNERIASYVDPGKIAEKSSTFRRLINLLASESQ